MRTVIQATVMNGDAVLAENVSVEIDSVRPHELHQGSLGEWSGQFPANPSDAIVDSMGSPLSLRTPRGTGRIFITQISTNSDPWVVAFRGAGAPPPEVWA